MYQLCSDQNRTGAELAEDVTFKQSRRTSCFNHPLPDYPVPTARLIVGWTKDTCATFAWRSKCPLMHPRMSTWKCSIYERSTFTRSRTNDELGTALDVKLIIVCSSVSSSDDSFRPQILHPFNDFKTGRFDQINNSTLSSLHSNAISNDPVIMRVIKHGKINLLVAKIESEVTRLHIYAEILTPTHLHATIVSTNYVYAYI